MKKSIFWLLIVLIILISLPAAEAAGISDTGIKAIFPAGTKVVDNQTLNVPGQGYYGAEILVTVPYKEKLSHADADYDVQFYFRKQIMDYCRKESEAIVKQNMANFAKGKSDYWGTELEFDKPGTISEKIPPDGSISTETTAPPQKGEVAGGVVWSQRTETRWVGRTQVYYHCFYAARVGDFVATLVVDVPDSRGTADQWFQKLIVACKSSK